MPVEKSARRNPPWHRDELILALDLYERLGRTVADDKHSDVIALSQLLNKLPLHTGRPDAIRFRNANGVALKLANFRAIEQPGRGMSRGNRLEQVVWDEFADNPKRLAAAAEAIRDGQAGVVSATPVAEYVSSPKEIRTSLQAFNSEASIEQQRAKKLLQGTTYWVYEPDSGEFGPAKFVGLVDMTLKRYEVMRHNSDGGVTHRTIERVLDDGFLEHTEWHPLLLSWGERLLGEAAFGKAEAAKWRFVSLRPHSSTGAATAVRLSGRRGTTELADAEAISYVLREVKRDVTPTHRLYQQRLGTWLKGRGVTPMFEENFVDVRFTLDGAEFIGEVKPSKNLSLDEAFRIALGQVLFYGFVSCDSLPGMIVFLDREPDEKRLRLASKLGVSVVVAIEEGKFKLLNPEVAQPLASVF